MEEWTSMFDGECDKCKNIKNRGHYTREYTVYDGPRSFVCEEHPTDAQLPTLTRPVTPDGCPIYADTRRVATWGRSIGKDRIERVGWRRDL